MGRPRKGDSRASTLRRLAVGEAHVSELELGSLRDAPRVKRDMLKVWWGASKGIKEMRFVRSTEVIFSKGEGLSVRITVKRLA